MKTHSLTCERCCDRPAECAVLVGLYDELTFWCDRCRRELRKDGNDITADRVRAAIGERMQMRHRPWMPHADGNLRRAIGMRVRGFVAAVRRMEAA